MRNALCLSVVFVLISVAAAAERGAKAGAKLAGEKKIMTVPTRGDARVKVRPGAMRLSPDGKGLLFFRRETIRIKDGERERTRRVYRLVLRDLAAGTDKVLPIPALFSDDIAAM